MWIASSIAPNRGWSPHCDYPAWDDDRARQLVRQFDLPLDRQLRHLSRGMRMKAAFASSLAYRPRLLIMDEPFSGLDPLVREDLIDGLLESASQTTIFVSSHDLGEIESFASHIGYLDRGRLQFSEEMASLTARFREVEVLLDSPPLVPLDRPWPAHWLRPETAPAWSDSSKRTSIPTERPRKSVASSAMSATSALVPCHSRPSS